MASQEQDTPPGTVHGAPAARTAVAPTPPVASLWEALPAGGGIRASCRRERKSQSKNDDRIHQCGASPRHVNGRPGPARLRPAQHWARVAFISSSKLLSSVESLHFPSTDTDFSPFFTRRQTWWPWMERLYMEAQESTLSTTEKW